jgi:hypothetical protein
MTKPISKPCSKTEGVIDPLLLHVNTRPTEALVPIIHHMFDAYGKEIRAQCLHTLAYLGFHLIIMIEVFPF